MCTMCQREDENCGCGTFYKYRLARKRAAKTNRLLGVVHAGEVPPSDRQEHRYSDSEDESDLYFGQTLNNVGHRWGKRDGRWSMSPVTDERAGCWTTTHAYDSWNDRYNDKWHRSYGLRIPLSSWGPIWCNGIRKRWILWNHEWWFCDHDRDNHGSDRDDGNNDGNDGNQDRTKITTAAAATDQTMEVTPQLTATMFSISRRNNPALSLAELKASFLLFSRMIAHDTLLPAKELDPMRGKHL